MYVLGMSHDVRRFLCVLSACDPCNYSYSFYTFLFHFTSKHWTGWMSIPVIPVKLIIILENVLSFHVHRNAHHNQYPYMHSWTRTECMQNSSHFIFMHTLELLSHWRHTNNSVFLARWLPRCDEAIGARNTSNVVNNEPSMFCRQWHRRQKQSRTYNLLRFVLPDITHSIRCLSFAL